MGIQIEGLGEVQVLPPERVPLRLRGGGTTLSGWRISIEAARGPGALVLVERAGEKHFRGEGVFLGWSQERLEAAYRALLPASQPPDPDFPQLG